MAAHFPYYIQRQDNGIVVCLIVRGRYCGPKRFYHEELLSLMAEGGRRAAESIAEEVCIPQYIDLTTPTPTNSSSGHGSYQVPVEVIDLTNDDSAMEESSASESVTLGSSDTESSPSMDDNADPEFIPLPDEPIPHAIKRRRTQEDNGENPQF